MLFLHASCHIWLDAAASKRSACMTSRLLSHCSCGRFGRQTQSDTARSKNVPTLRTIPRPLDARGHADPPVPAPPIVRTVSIRTFTHGTCPGWCCDRCLATADKGKCVRASLQVLLRGLRGWRQPGGACQRTTFLLMSAA
jgi:hypothetical protein